MSKEKKSALLEFIVITAIMSAIVFGITIGFGTITSGWHFVDDHEFLEYDYRLNVLGDSVWDVIKTEMRMNLSTRFQLLFYPVRVLTAYFVGANATVLAIFKATETILCMVLLYYVAKGLDASKGTSLLFSLLSMTGYQSALWWKLGAEHLKAEICFLITFLLLIKYLKSGKKSFGFGSFFFAVLMCGFHESFIMLLVFLALFAAFNATEFDEVSGLKKINRNMFKRRHVIYALSAVILFVQNIIIILAKLGVNSYPGVGTSGGVLSTISQYVKSTDYSLRNDLRWYCYLGMILIAILLTYYAQIKQLWVYIVLALIFMLPQFVLYAKEGMAERYLIPAVIGFALFFVVWIERAKILSGGRKKVYIATLVLMLALNAFGAIVEADYFRFRGQSVTRTLEAIETLEDNGYTVMSCFGNANPEADWTVEMYMKSHRKDDILYWNQDNDEVLTARPYKRSADIATADFNDVDVVVAYNRNDRHFTLEPSCDLSDFECVKCGSIDIYCRKSVSDDAINGVLGDMSVKPTLFGIGA